jgi:hypothetical protein
MPFFMENVSFHISYVQLSVFFVARLVALAIVLPAFCLQIFGSDAQAQQKADERYASKHAEC